jgi:hypothetical protein
VPGGSNKALTQLFEGLNSSKQQPAGSADRNQTADGSKGDMVLSAETNSTTINSGSGSQTNMRSLADALSDKGGVQHLRDVSNTLDAAGSVLRSIQKLGGNGNSNSIWVDSNNSSAGMFAVFEMISSSNGSSEFTAGAYGSSADLHSAAQQQELSVLQPQQTQQTQAAPRRQHFTVPIEFLRPDWIGNNSSSKKIFSSGTKPAAAAPKKAAVAKRSGTAAAAAAATAPVAAATKASSILNTASKPRAAAVKAPAAPKVASTPAAAASVSCAPAAPRPFLKARAGGVLRTNSSKPNTVATATGSSSNCKVAGSTSKMASSVKMIASSSAASPRPKVVPAARATAPRSTISSDRLAQGPKAAAAAATAQSGATHAAAAKSSSLSSKHVTGSKAVTGVSTTPAASRPALSALRQQQVSRWGAGKDTGAQAAAAAAPGAEQASQVIMPLLPAEESTEQSVAAAQQATGAGTTNSTDSSSSSSSKSTFGSAAFLERRMQHKLAKHRASQLLQQGLLSEEGGAEALRSSIEAAVTGQFGGKAGSAAVKALYLNGLPADPDAAACRCDAFARHYDENRTEPRCHSSMLLHKMRAARKAGKAAAYKLVTKAQQQGTEAAADSKSSVSISVSSVCEQLVGRFGPAVAEAAAAAVVKHGVPDWYLQQQGLPSLFDDMQHLQDALRQL